MLASEIKNSVLPSICSSLLPGKNPGVLVAYTCLPGTPISSLPLPTISMYKTLLSLIIQGSHRLNLFPIQSYHLCWHTPPAWLPPWPGLFGMLPFIVSVTNLKSSQIVLLVWRLPKRLYLTYSSQNHYLYITNILVNW